MIYLVKLYGKGILIMIASRLAIYFLVIGLLMLSSLL
jgi:hypothetical protein